MSWSSGVAGNAMLREAESITVAVGGRLAATENGRSTGNGALCLVGVVCGIVESISPEQRWRGEGNGGVNLSTTLVAWGGASRAWEEEGLIETTDAAAAGRQAIFRILAASCRSKRCPLTP